MRFLIAWFLKRDLTRCSRTGRAVRKPCHKPGQRKNRIPDTLVAASSPFTDSRSSIKRVWQQNLGLGRFSHEIAGGGRVG